MVKKGAHSVGSRKKKRSARTSPGSKISTLKRHDALLIIDAINDLTFPGGENVLPWALRLAPRLARFKRQARKHDMPVIYVNDNFGNWRSNFMDVYAHCTRPAARGKAICRRLRPNSQDYFILKPRHSVFYATSLVPLLEDLRISRLILAGIATNLCVLFSAHDAHMRDYKVTVLSDCCAAESDEDHNQALSHLQRFCHATVCRSTEYRFP